MMLTVSDKDTLADVLLHLPRYPIVEIEDGDDRREKFFTNREKAKDFLIQAFREVVLKKGGRIIVRDEA